MPLPSSAEVRVNTTTAGHQSEPQILGLTGGGYVVLWETADRDVMGQRFSASGTPIGGEFVAGAGLAPGAFSATALSDGGFLVTYRAGSAVNPDLSLARFDAGGARTATAVATAASGNDTEPTVTALSGGGVALSWLNSDSSGAVRLQLQLFDAGLAPRATSLTVATSHLGGGGSATVYPGDPAIIQLANGNVALVWTEIATGFHGISNGDVRLQIYSPTGTPVGTTLTPSSTTTTSHTVGSPAICATADGGYVIGWYQQAGNMGATTGQVVIRKFAADGTGGSPISYEVGVSNRASLDLAATPDGGFVLSWSGGAGSDVFLQSFDAQGQAVGGPVTVNSNTNGLQTDADVAVLQGGAQAVAWRSDGQDGDGGGIYLRTFGAAEGGDSFPQTNVPTPPVTTLFERHLPNGTAPGAGPLSVSGAFTISAQDGLSDLIVGGRTVIDDGVFTATTLTTPFGERLEITGFNASTGEVSYRYTLTTAHRHAEFGIVEGKVENDAIDIAVVDRDGDTTHATLSVGVGDDRPVPNADADTIAAGSTAPATGNVLTDASPGDAGDSDNGADRLGADGGGLAYARTAEGTGGGPISAGGQVTVQGTYGVLTLQSSGDYSYAVRPDAPAGAVDSFEYSVRENDNSQFGWRQSSLTITVTSGSPPSPPPPPPPPPGGDGQVINSPGPGSTLVGGAGNDTLIASQGPDVLTGAGGGDAFVYRALPWNAGRITDFTLGSDRIDLSAIFQASGYTGSDPVADGRMRFDSDGSGGTRLFFDRDAPNAGDWPFLITTLDHVATGGLTWAQLSGGAPPSPPPPPPPPPSGGDGQVINSPGPGSTLVGGAGNDTLNASQGPDVLTGNGGGDTFAYRALPWNAGHVTDFTLGSDRLDLSAIFQASGYLGSDPVADGRMRFEADGAGGTRVYFDRDAPNAGDWPFLITTLDHVATGGLTWARLSGGAPPSPPPPPPPPSGGDGQVISSPGPGSTLMGGAGNDTLNASQGPDVLTGAGGADHFAFARPVWNAGRITDFQDGADRIDLRGLLDLAGYTGTDAIADRYVLLEATSGGTRVIFDQDGPNANGDWPITITTLSDIPPSLLTAGDFIFQ